MITNDTIEEYLIETGLPFEQVKEGLWLVHDEVDYIDNIVVYHTPPVITFRVKLLDVEDVTDISRLYRHLLELNATSMVAGAYGLEDNAVVVVDTLQSANLDFNEFQASIDAIAMAIREHYDDLKQFVADGGAAEPAASTQEAGA